MQKKVILVDSDVISHFIAANKIDDLSRILFPHSLLVVQQVYEESIRHPFFDNRKEEVDSWMMKGHIQKIDFPYQNNAVKLEFYRIKKENPERVLMTIIF